MAVTDPMSSTGMRGAGAGNVMGPLGGRGGPATGGIAGGGAAGGGAQPQAKPQLTPANNKPVAATPGGVAQAAPQATPQPGSVGFGGTPNPAIYKPGVGGPVVNQNVPSRSVLKASPATPQPASQNQTGVYNPQSIAKLASQIRDLLPGGLADNQPNSAFPHSELLQGRKVEQEHTDNPALSNEIAKDHLTEDTHYYDNLEKMEDRGPNSSTDEGHEGIQKARGVFGSVPQKLANASAPSIGLAIKKAMDLINDSTLPKFKKAPIQYNEDISIPGTNWGKGKDIFENEDEDCDEECEKSAMEKAALPMAMSFAKKLLPFAGKAIAGGADDVARAAGKAVAGGADDAARAAVGNGARVVRGARTPFSPRAGYQHPLGLPPKGGTGPGLTQPGTLNPAGPLNKNQTSIFEHPLGQPAQMNPGIPTPSMLRRSPVAQAPVAAAPAAAAPSAADAIAVARRQAPQAMQEADSGIGLARARAMGRRQAPQAMQEADSGISMAARAKSPQVTTAPAAQAPAATAPAAQAADAATAPATNAAAPAADAAAPAAPAATPDIAEQPINWKDLALAGGGGYLANNALGYLFGGGGAEQQQQQAPPPPQLDMWGNPVPPWQQMLGKQGSAILCKTADAKTISPFAASFFDGCLRRGYSFDKFQHIIKVASEKYPEIADELGVLADRKQPCVQAYEKSAAIWAPVKNFAQGMLGKAKGLFAGGGAGRAMAQSQKMLPFMADDVAGAAAGATGAATNAAGAAKPWLKPNGFAENWLWNPAAGYVGGSTLGYGADQAAGALGYDDTNFMGYGGMIGAGMKSPLGRKVLNRMQGAGGGVPGRGASAVRSVGNFANDMMLPTPEGSGWRGMLPKNPFASGLRPGERMARGLGVAGAAGTAGGIGSVFLPHNFDVSKPFQSVNRMGENMRQTAMDKSINEMSGGIYKNRQDWMNSPFYRVAQAYSGQNGGSGGIMAAIGAGWNELEPWQQNMLLAGGATGLGGLAAGAMGHTGLGMGLGAAGLGIGAAGLLGGSQNILQSHLQNAGLGQEQQQQLLRQMPELLDLQSMPRNQQSQLMQELMKQLQGQQHGQELAAASGQQ